MEFVLKLMMIFLFRFYVPSPMIFRTRQHPGAVQIATPSIQQHLGNVNGALSYNRLVLVEIDQDLPVTVNCCDRT